MKKLLDRLLGKGASASPADGNSTPSPADSGRYGDTGFQPRNALEHSLMAAAENPDRRAEFEELLLRSELYVGIPMR